MLSKFLVIKLSEVDTSLSDFSVRFYDLGGDFMLRL